MTTSLRGEQHWLERMISSKLIGVCMIDEDGHFLQRFDDDPQLHQLLIDHQKQRMGEMAQAVTAVTGQPMSGPVAHTVRPSAANDFYSPDGSGGQAGDDASFAQGIATLNSRATTPFNQPPPFPGS